MHPDSVVHFYQAPRGKSVGVLSQAASLLSLSTNSMSAEARKLEEEAEVTPVSPDLPPIICFPGKPLLVLIQLFFSVIVFISQSSSLSF